MEPKLHPGKVFKQAQSAQRSELHAGGQANEERALVSSVPLKRLIKIVTRDCRQHALRAASDKAALAN